MSTGGASAGHGSRQGAAQAPQRWILHVDMDAFYAAVETKEDPSLEGLAVVVGGTGHRGVVCSASYEARAWGVHSAMPMSQARRLCPHGVYRAPQFDAYQRYSKRLHHVFKGITPLVEGIALDEAFLDITGSMALFGPPRQIALEIRRAVRRELGLDCSVGGGPNKLVSKLASKEAKPRSDRSGVRPGPGTVLVGPAEVLGFLWKMPVGSLWGIGRASQERLARVGVTTIGSLAALPPGAVVSALGKAAGELAYELAWGRDDRTVEPDRPVKSIGHEETYPSDVADREELRQRLVVMADSVASRLRHHGFVAKTVTLKLRYDDFTTITRSHTFPAPQVTGVAFWRAASELLSSLELRNGVRLLGVTASGLVPEAEAPGEQLQLDLASPIPVLAPAGTGTGSGPSSTAAWEKASRVMDAVRERFGDEALGPASVLGSQRRQKWPQGPDGHG